MGPSLVGTTIETIGTTLEFLGPGGLEKFFLTRIPSVGKESWFAQEGETSGTILVGKDRDRGRISRDVTRRCVIVGSKIEVDGCPSCIRRPYKTTGFTLRVSYFAFSPSHRQLPSLIARASRIRIVAAVKLAYTAEPTATPPNFCQWSRGAGPTSPLSA